MLSYSIAIRTLGLGGDKFLKEMESISRQTIQPQKILVYIADGYTIPKTPFGSEIYIYVKKGMVSQRLLDYDDIDSDVIFMLDDDVELEQDSAEKMLRAMEEHGADCVGAETFLTHKLPLLKKIEIAMTGWVFPAFKPKWAFHINKDAAFSYNNNPTEAFYWSQSCPGPAFMIKKSVYQTIRLQDEIWLDSLGFAYGDDMLETYKVYVNGFRLGVLYDSGCKHLDAGTSSNDFRKGEKRLFIKAKAILAIWWRAILSPMDSTIARLYTFLIFLSKCLWITSGLAIYSIFKLSLSPVQTYIQGLISGWKFVHSPEFRNLPPYRVA